MNWYKTSQVLSGGKSEGKSPEDYPQSALQKGIQVEMEHTDDPEIAERIAMDHLEESIEYYDYLEEMEKKLEKK